jgi:hypothetical protein
MELYIVEYESEMETGTIEVYASNKDEAELLSMLELQDDSIEIIEVYLN